MFVTSCENPVSAVRAYCNIIIMCIAAHVGFVDRVFFSFLFFSPLPQSLSCFYLSNTVTQWCVRAEHATFALHENVCVHSFGCLRVPLMRCVFFFLSLFFPLSEVFSVWLLAVTAPSMFFSAVCFLCTPQPQAGSVRGQQLAGVQRKIKKRWRRVEWISFNIIVRRCFSITDYLAVGGTEYLPSIHWPGLTSTAKHALWAKLLLAQLFPVAPFLNKITCMNLFWRNSQSSPVCLRIVFR